MEWGYKHRRIFSLTTGIPFLAQQLCMSGLKQKTWILSANMLHIKIQKSSFALQCHIAMPAVYFGGMEGENYIQSSCKCTQGELQRDVHRKLFSKNLLTR